MLQVPGIQSTIKIGHDKYGLPYLTASSRELPILTIAFAYAAGYDFRRIGGFCSSNLWLRHLVLVVLLRGGSLLRSGIFACNG